MLAVCLPALTCCGACRLAYEIHLTHPQHPPTVSACLQLVGAEPEDLVFQPNATTAVNAVLQSIQVGPYGRGPLLCWLASFVDNPVV